jgi:hypothetical protein
MIISQVQIVGIKEFWSRISVFTTERNVWKQNEVFEFETADQNRLLLT